MRKIDRIFQIAVFSTAFLFLSTLPVRAAYIDPSVMTYAIQAISGVVIALGTFFGVYRNRIRKALLGSEHRSDEMESDALEFRDPQSNETVTTGITDQKAAGGTGDDKRVPLRPAVFLSLAMGFMLCLYKPLELYFTNIIEFDYDIFDILKYILLLFAAAALFILIAYVIARLISKKLYTVLIALGLIAFIAFYVQGNILVANLPPSDGSEVDWSQYRGEEIKSIVLWVLSAAAVLFVCLKFKRRGLFRIMELLSAAVSGILAVSLILVCVQNDGLHRKEHTCIGTDYLNVMSEDKNFVIFVVDAAGGKTFMDLTETTDPDYKDIFQDFTFYPDTLGAYQVTRLAVPQILTGYWFEAEEDFETWYVKKIHESAFLKRLESEGYISGVYDQQDFPVPAEDIDRYENVSMRPYGLKSVKTFLLDELRMIFFMYMPFQLKKYEPYALFNLSNQRPADYYYTWYDDENYKYFRDTRFETAPEKRFRFIHIMGAHPPYQFDKQMNDVEDTEEATYENMYRASVTVLQTYLERLKENGTYDNSVIVILGDHGLADHVHTETRQNPLLLIKGLNESHEFTVSDLPISYDYLPEIYQNLLNEKTGEAVIPEIARENPPRKYVYHGFDDIYHQEVRELKNGKAYEVEAEPTGEIIGN